MTELDRILSDAVGAQPPFMRLYEDFERAVYRASGK